MWVDWMIPGALTAALFLLLVGPAGEYQACNGEAYADFPGTAVEIRGKEELGLSLAPSNNTLERHFAIDILVNSNPKNENFLINVCTEPGCPNPSDSIVSSFSFFPVPSAGDRKTFTFSMPRSATSKWPDKLYLEIEGIEGNADPSIDLSVQDFREE